MSQWIPKEKLTAYQRWELADFNQPADAPAAQPTVDEPPPVDRGDDPPGTQSLPQEAAVLMPTAEDLERLHHEAHAAGYAEGYQEGLSAAQSKATRLAALLDQLQQALANIDQAIADQLLALGVEIASQVLRQSLRIRPELVLPIVREAVMSLHAHHGQPLLFVSPDDAALIRSRLGDQLAHNNWRIMEDAALTAGGCRVELGASEVDATLETRWRRVIEAIGISDQWLADAEQNAPTTR